jgi:uncharacterized protein involved in exopolysaccharide biosynthesis
MPVRVKELEEIKQKVEAMRELYKFLQEHKEETAISRASTISNSAVVDRAFATNTPIKPNRRSIQMLAILLGLALPALVSLLVKF